jgi:hypothetical protein
MEPHDDLASANEQEQVIRNGAAFEAAGLMAQGDYVRLARLSKDAVSSDDGISDTDLDWTLALLANATEAVVRSKVMVMLSVLGHRTLRSQAQKERIAAAVAPYLNCEHKLDQLSAARAMRATVLRTAGRLQPPSEN